MDPYLKVVTQSWGSSVPPVVHTDTGNELFKSGTCCRYQGLPLRVGGWRSSLKIKNCEPNIATCRPNRARKIFSVGNSIPFTFKRLEICLIGPVLNISNLLALTKNSSVRNKARLRAVAMPSGASHTERLRWDLTKMGRESPHPVSSHLLPSIIMAMLFSPEWSSSCKSSLLLDVPKKSIELPGYARPQWPVS